MTMWFLTQMMYLQHNPYQKDQDHGRREGRPVVTPAETGSVM